MDGWFRLRIQSIDATLLRQNVRSLAATQNGHSRRLRIPLVRWGLPAGVEFTPWLSSAGQGLLDLE